MMNTNMNNENMKKFNATMVLDAIRKYEPICRKDLAKIIGLTSSSITNIVSRLIAQNLLIETDTAVSLGGRKPVMLQLNPNARFVVGIELTTSHIMGIVTDFKAKKLCKSSVMIDRLSEKEIIFEQMISLIRALVKEANIPKGRIIGIAISAPGPYNHSEGVLTNPPNFPRWINVNIKKIIEDALSVPVILEKETVAAAFGEYWLGGLSHGESLFAINSMKVGLGGGAIIGGKIFHGFSDGAGDLGHMTIDVDGPKCSCGNYGCLESLASEVYMKREAISKIKRGVDTVLTSMVKDLEDISVKEIVRGSAEGDNLCISIIEEAARYLGIGIANIINVMSPDIIVIGGELTIECPEYVEKAIQYVRQKKYPIYNRSVVIKQATYGDEMCVIGAVSILLKDFFEKIQ